MARIKCTEMDHIVLNVSDVERSLRFYSEVEGFSHESTLGGQAGRRLERRLAVGAGLVF